MHLVTIAWLYVALMMAVAEGLHPQGSWLGAALTFALYGAAPVSLVIYLLGTPARRARRRAAEEAETAEAGQVASTPALADAAPAAHDSDDGAVAPDEGGHAARANVAPVREIP